MSNLLDLMTPEDKKKAIDAYHSRMKGDTSYRSGKVSPQVYLIAELGYHFGWGAVEAIKRGYIETFDEHTGKRQKQLFTMEEACALAEGARKVWYSKVVDEARGVAAGTGAANSKNANSTFRSSMKHYIERAKL